MKISWLACYDSRDGKSRMCTWSGKTKAFVVTGLPPGFVGNAPMAFDLPDGAEVHEVPPGANGSKRAHSLGGVLFTVFDKERE